MASMQLVLLFGHGEVADISTHQATPKKLYEPSNIEYESNFQKLNGMFSKGLGSTHQVHILLYHVYQASDSLKAGSDRKRSKDTQD